MTGPPVIPHGGTRPKPPSELRSPVLRRCGAAAAESSYRRIYETWPEMAGRYGERGKSLTAEDNFWHLNFLDSATHLGDPAHFDRYADWLLSFLTPRGMGPHHIAGAFGFLADAIGSAEIEPGEEDHRRTLVSTLSDTASRLMREAESSDAADPADESDGADGSQLGQ